MALLRDLLNWLITRVAWLVADWRGWRAALAVYPPMLQGKVCIVTGANAGLGLEATKALLAQGATVVMACRSLEAGAVARKDILADSANHGPIASPPPEQRLRLLLLDLEEFDSVPRFVEQFRGLGLPGLHLLVNNAGVHLKPHKIVSCGFERTMAVNYFGAAWLTQLLLDDLTASAPARIVNVASISEQLVNYTLNMPTIIRRGLRGERLTDSGERSYVIAKVLLMMWSRELARRLEGSGVDVITVHPGIADSTWSLKSDNEAYLFAWLVARARALLGPSRVHVGQRVETGAISTIYASIAPELAGATSAVASRGPVDALARAVLGRVSPLTPAAAGGVKRDAAAGGDCGQLAVGRELTMMSSCEQARRRVSAACKQLSNTRACEKLPSPLRCRKPPCNVCQPALAPNPLRSRQQEGLHWCPPTTNTCVNACRRRRWRWLLTAVLCRWGPGTAACRELGLNGSCALGGKVCTWWQPAGRPPPGCVPSQCRLRARQLTCAGAQARQLQHVVLLSGAAGAATGLA